MEVRVNRHSAQVPPRQGQDQLAGVFFRPVNPRNQDQRQSNPGVLIIASERRDARNPSGLCDEGHRLAALPARSLAPPTR